MKRKRPVIPTLRRLGSRAARLLAFLPAMFVLAVPSVLYADPIQVGTAATPVRQVGSIDCNGNPGTGSFGLMKVSRTGDSLEVDVELTGARANTSFSIELWESDPDCYPDNNGNTGVVISTDSSGNGTATVNLSLPHPSLGGSTLGDGAGTDQLVMALDDTFSSGGGDSYAAGPISIDFTDTNRPPEVSAGYDTSGNSSSGAYVEGSVFDDGKKEPVVNTWSKVSGPGVATFDDPHSTSTHVSFDKLGTYTLKLSAYDGEFTGTDTVIVEVKDRYEVELKSWIPQSTTADPFVLAPTNFPNAAIPLMGSPLRECFESEWDGTANGSVRVLSSRFTGDNHDDYGQFASQRSPRDARIASYLEFEWDGSQMRVTDSSKWFGTTRRYVTIQTRDGGSKECQQAARADTATVPDVQMIAPNKFKLVVKGYDPLTPRDANQLSSVIGDACTVTPLLCPPLASLL
ncbi:MAG TPA: hypothetical protein VLA92_02720, partial [Candidatus Saccharimonadales bacterium]|nr:hypothetical protein [Candidatus Saccharimonadales bacterium]